MVDTGQLRLGMQYSIGRIRCGIHEGGYDICSQSPRAVVAVSASSNSRRTAYDRYLTVVQAFA